jgi:hypothetical protein
MNVERLYDLVAYLREKNSELAMQRSLVDLKTHLTNLANQPQNEAQQLNVATSINTLSSVFERFEEMTSPPQKVLIREINGEPFFSKALTDLVRVKLVENAMTPTVVSSFITEMTAEREAYLTTLEAVRQGLEALGAKQAEPSPGDVELGVLIPRDLFHNELGDLAQELEVINRIIQTFSEVVTGSVEPVEVRQISTSDPTIFLGVPVITLLAIGKATDWLIEKWKAIEEIRKVRVEVSKLEIEAAIGPMDDKINEMVKASVQEQVSLLIGQYKGERGRKNELENSIEWALDSLISRIERGMTIEIRVLAPPQENVDDDDSIKPEVYEDVDAVGRRLQSVRVFEQKPILKLPPPKPPDGADEQISKTKKAK